MTAPKLVLQHVCEVCGLTEVLSSEDGYSAGWDYPPSMGAFGVLSARTCPSCPINKTLWWRVMFEGLKQEDFTEEDKILLTRVLAEPASIMLQN